MLRMAVCFFLLASASTALARDPANARLNAPAGWSAETIRIPPGFAPDMKWKGIEQVRFAPGMMKPDSDNFFCYALVLELRPKVDLSKSELKQELLKYYRGLCRAVLGQKANDVNTDDFKLVLSRSESENEDDTMYSGTLDWVEPFATQDSQKLNLEIWTWEHDDASYLLVCVSPKPTKSEIWSTLRSIRRGYRQSQLKTDG